MGLKVYGIGLGRERSIVAAPNQTAAAKALGFSLYSFRQYASVTVNAEEIETAMAEPGVPFFAPYSGPCRGTYSKLREHERQPL